MSLDQEIARPEHSISIVVPVRRGQEALGRLIEELFPLTRGARTPMGKRLRVTEILLVHDGDSDRSREMIDRLASQAPFVRPIWLSRSFGHDAASLAGMALTDSDWIVTLDEMRLLAPGDIARMLDVALAQGTPLVYAMESIPRPHGVLRSLGQAVTEYVTNRIVSDGTASRTHSGRLMLGETGRRIAAYVGPSVYLDVALSWAFPRAEHCDVVLDAGSNGQTGYSRRDTRSRFRHLVIMMGARPLRLVSWTGMLIALAGAVLALVLLAEKIAGTITVSGWTSVAVVVLVLSGLSILALGVVAEFVGASVNMAMGKPLYLHISDPTASGHERHLDSDPSNDG